MKNVMTGQVAARTVTPTQLSAYRRAIMDTLVGAQVITTAEYDTAMQRTLACQDVATLQKWYRNCIREIARREEALPTVEVVRYATPTQTDEIHKLSLHRVITRAERAAAILDLPRLTTAKATALIGELWAKIVQRTGGVVGGLTSSAAASYSSAA